MNNIWLCKWSSDGRKVIWSQEILNSSSILVHIYWVILVILKFRTLLFILVYVKYWYIPHKKQDGVVVSVKYCIGSLKCVHRLHSHSIFDYLGLIILLWKLFKTLFIKFLRHNVARFRKILVFCCFSLSYPTNDNNRQLLLLPIHIRYYN